MTLEESIGRYNIRKSLRFELKPVARTADYLDEMLAGDEDRAAGLNTLKAVFEAEHLTMVRRVFRRLPDPLPDALAIKRAFRDDPEYATLTGRSSNNVLKLIIDRCKYNRLQIPQSVWDAQGWQPLIIKWHWHCSELYKFGPGSFLNDWAGKSKAEVEATSPLLRTPKKRKPSRNYWFDHGPFRMMFDNHSCGMSWLKDDFRISRVFLLRDGDRTLIGVVPRKSKFNPYTLANPLPTEQFYFLYEETAGELPKLRPVPRALVDAPAHKGFIYLFELNSRGLRNKTNLNAMYLRSLFSPDNLAEPVFHLDSICEFFARKGSEIPKEGKPDHFRQRFTESKFFVTLHVTCNPQMVSTGTRPLPYGDLAKLIGTNPYAKFIQVMPAQGGYMIGEKYLPTAVAKSGGMAGLLAKMVVETDSYVIFDESVPADLRRAVKDKFDYIVVRGRDPFAAGGVMKGYQLVDRLFVGSIAAAKSKVDAAKAEADRKEAERIEIERRHQAKLAEKAARKAYAEEQLKRAQVRRAIVEKTMTEANCDIFDIPLFKTGRFLFRFVYKTSDNVRHENTCRADEKNDVFQKLRTIGIKACRVECDDPAYVGVRKDLPGPEVGSKVFEYAFRDSRNIRHDGTVRADTKEEAYEKLRKIAIKPFFVAEEGVPPPNKPKYDLLKETEGILPESVAATIVKAAQIATAPDAAAAQPVEEKKPLTIGDRLKRLNALKEQGLLSEPEYAEQRAKILSEL